MKTNKTIFLILTLSLIIITISGCSGSSGQVKRTDFKLHSGITGLDAKFRVDAPPTEIGEEQTFQILLDLQNKGAYAIKNGIYNLGLEPGIITLKENLELDKFNLRGKEAFNPEGEIKLLKFFAQSKKLPALQETYTSTISFTTCYDYQTKATATVCIDSDIYKTQKTKACTVSDVSLSGGQGAPISILKISPKMLLHNDKTRLKPEFTITISNKGNGKIYAKGYGAEACSSAPLKEKWNRAQIRVYLSEIELDCKSVSVGDSVFVDLSKGTNTVKCSLEQGQPLSLGTYTTAISVELDYGYTFTKTKQVKIGK